MVEDDFPFGLLIVGIILVVLLCALSGCGGGDPEDFDADGNVKTHEVHAPATPERKDSL